MANSHEHIRAAQVATKEADNLLNGQHGPWPSEQDLKDALPLLRSAAHQIIEAQFARHMEKVQATADE